MSNFPATRRAALVFLGALALARTAFLQSALARRPVQSARIRVDVSPLREHSGDPTATWVERELPGAIERALAGRMPNAPMIVRIDYVTLGPNTGATVHGGSSPDNIRGVAIIGGAQIPIQATTSYMASPIDQTMIEQSNHERVSRLVEAFVFWLAAAV